MFFQEAKPIFPKKKSEEMNVFAAFQADVSSLSNATIFITASTFYRLYVNGKFVGEGPARTARGYARVDEIELSRYNLPANTITVFVSGYYCRSLSTVCEPSFLTAEVRKGDTVLAATGKDFRAFLPKTRIQKVPRYSLQRHFMEIYDFSSGISHNKEAEESLDLYLPANEPAVEIETVAPPLYLPRKAPYPCYEDINLTSASSRGKLIEDSGRTIHTNFYSAEPEGQFPAEEIVYHPYEWIQAFKCSSDASDTPLPVKLNTGEYAMFDFGKIEVGFIKFTATCEEESDIIIGFSEDSDKEQFTFTDMHVQNTVEWILPANKTIRAMSFEPYTLKHLIVAVKKGSVSLQNIGIKSFVRDIREVSVPKMSDPILTNIYQAAMRTFSHNALDLFTDCPSRERSGWLCDSYFTAQTEYMLYHETPTEDAFLENFLLFEDTEGNYPFGVIPMTYPSDNLTNSKFIPQWTMWFILEAEQYINERNHGDMREAFQKRIYDLLTFYEKYEDEDGLLESLPSWNFVEWSRANEWTKDVSYPTNFLYAKVLECVYRIYNDENAKKKAERVRKTTIDQSFNGTLFRDHAVRKDGKLQILEDISEACQYYAILFGGVDLKEEKYKELERLVLKVVGAKRTEVHEEIAEINAFIGAYLRLKVLLLLNEDELLLRNVKDFFGSMGEETGTLWEYRERHGSRDHGFASFAIVAIRKALHLDEA